MRRRGGSGRHPYPLKVMLKIHLMQNWFGLSDPAMEEAYEIASMRQFAGLSLTKPIPYETTILNFGRLLETYELAAEILSRVNGYLSRKDLMLKRGTIVDATTIAAPSSTKNAMATSRKGVDWQIAHRRSDVKSMPEGREKRAIEKAEKRKTSIRARVERPLRVVKRQFGYVKARFKGLAKNTAQILALFALSKLWMARKRLLAMTGELRLKTA